MWGVNGRDLMFYVILGDELYIFIDGQTACNDTVCMIQGGFFLQLR